MRRASGEDDYTLFGYCMGGTMAVMHAALRPEGLRNLIALTTPVDFSEGGLMALWTDKKFYNPDRLVAAYGGNIPPDTIDTGNKLLKPVTNYVGAHVTMWDRLLSGKDMGNWLAMNKWVNDGTPFPGAAFSQWIRRFYQDNALMTGDMTIKGDPVDLSRITAPLLSIAGEADHIVPPEDGGAADRHGLQQGQRVRARPGRPRGPARRVRRPQGAVAQGHRVARLPVRLTVRTTSNQPPPLRERPAPPRRRAAAERARHGGRAGTNDTRPFGSPGRGALGARCGPGHPEHSVKGVFVNEAVIASAVRTPIGTFGGGLADVPATELGATVIAEALKRAGVDPDQVDEVIMGNVLRPASARTRPARPRSRPALPDTVPAMTINKVCGSGLKTVALAAQAIIARRRRDRRRRRHGEHERRARTSCEKARYGYRMGDGEIVDRMIHDGLWCALDRLPHGHHRRERRHRLRDLPRRPGRASPPQSQQKARPRRSATAPSTTRSSPSRSRSAGATVRSSTTSIPRPTTSVEGPGQAAPRLRRRRHASPPATPPASTTAPRPSSS